MKVIFALLLVLCITAGVESAATQHRRLGLPAWAKNALKGMSKQVVNTIIDCLVSEIKSKGLGLLKKIPGVKMVANKLVGGPMDALAGKVKSVVDKAIDAAISKLRRRRRAGLWGAIKGAAGKAAGAVGNAAGAAKAFAGKMAASAGAVANAVHGVAAKVNNLTGGKLSSALQNFVCPAVVKGISSAISTALTSIGWVFGVPACLTTALTNGCKAAIKAGFKRYMRRRLMAKRRLGLPAWAKNALKGMSKQVVNTIIDCLVSEIKSKGLGLLKKIPGVKMVANKLVGGPMDALAGKVKSVVDKAIDAAISKLRRRRRAGLFGAIKGAASKAAGAVGDAAGAAKAFAGKMAASAGAVANAVHGVAAKVNNLTGGKLSSALQNFVCPAVVKGISSAISTALTSIGWVFGVPACLTTALTNGCKAAIKAGFKRYMRRRLTHMHM